MTRSRFLLIAGALLAAGLGCQNNRRCDSNAPPPYYNTSTTPMVGPGGVPVVPAGAGYYFLDGGVVTSSAPAPAVSGTSTNTVSQYAPAPGVTAGPTTTNASPGFEVIAPRKSR